MTHKKYLIFLATFFFFLILVVFSVNFYFLTRLNKNGNRIKFAGDINEPFEQDESSFKLKSIYKAKNPKFAQIREQLVRNLTPCNRVFSNYSQLWSQVDKWSKDTTNEIYPQHSKIMCQLLTAMKEVPLIFAANSRRGTQFKMNLTVEGNKNIIFKPAWYLRNEVIEGEVYSGKDRHTSEILGFYLGSLLNFRWTSIVVGRAISLRDVFEIADKELQETIISKRNGSKLCVYGKCYYCNPNETVCGNKTHFIEGALLYNIEGTINKHKSPWQRTYKENQKAIWEVEGDANYCDNVKQKFSLVRLLDLIDASIFDFLIQNGDRHHYETRKNRIILLDNGKGFGNPHVDFADILAPLYQCCLIRKTTYARLLIFTGGSLSESLKELTKFDDLYPLITDLHYYALERRLLKLFSMIEFCRSKFGNEIFQ